MRPPDNASFFVIAGATACGKSEFAVRVAERCHGEIVAADAFQIYAGLEILTAQPEPALRARVPHHLFGEVPIAERFDVAQFAELACRQIAEIRARGGVPILCGGTGLYIRALLRGLADLPGADADLRAELERQSPDELARRLGELDPASAATIDLQNPRRVIRALEVCLLTGRPFSSFREQWTGDSSTRGVWLHRDRAELHSRIEARTESMFAVGVEDEVARASDAGETAERAIGFGAIRQLLARESDRAECIRLINEATRKYAKRQETWFRRETGLRRVDLSEVDLESVAEEIAREAASLD